VRYLVIVMMIPLISSGCLQSFAEDVITPKSAADVGKSLGFEFVGHSLRGIGQDVPYLGGRWWRQYWSNQKIRESIEEAKFLAEEEDKQNNRTREAKLKELRELSDQHVAEW
jgi:hypothetical protein